MNARANGSVALRVSASAVLLAMVAVLELAARITEVRVVQEIAWIAMGGVVVVNLRRLGVRELYLLGLSALLSLLIFIRTTDSARMLGAALDQASFLMAFILLLGLLHETASTSPSVAACGEYLTRQPPGRRYYALNIGTATLAVLFNIGVVSFLVPLIQKGIERAIPGDPLNPVREQRQISALLRGFAWGVIWSPTAIAPLAVAELIPGVDRRLWIEYGLAVFGVILIIGAFEERLRFRNYRPTGAVRRAEFPTGAVLHFLAACVWLFGMTALVMGLADETVVFGLLVACPFMAVGWLLAQFGFPRGGAIETSRRRLAEILTEGVPKSAPVAITLACSGFIGRAGAGLVPADALANLLRLDAVPDFVLLSILPLVMSLVSLLALSPIMLAVFFGSLFAALPVMPAEPTLIAFSISCGWALSMTFSPFATVVLLISRATGIPGRRLTWAWNLAFSAVCAATLVPVFWLLTGGS